MVCCLLAQNDLEVATQNEEAKAGEDSSFILFNHLYYMSTGNIVV